MKNKNLAKTKLYSNTYIAIAVGVLITGCGAGSNSDTSGSPEAKAGLAQQILRGPITTTINNPGHVTPMPTPIDPIGSIDNNKVPPNSILSSQAITGITIESTSLSNQTNIPFTFGQVFIAGDLNSSTKLAGRLEDGTLIPLQTDIKATNPDGSVRHAIVSGILPSLSSGKNLKIDLLKTSYTPKFAEFTAQNMLSSGFKAGATISINGVEYKANVQDALNNSSKKWLSGPTVNEWVFSAPFKNANGETHPHLNAVFSVRNYNKINKTKVDFSIENTWAYEPNPQNITYDVKLNINGNEVYSKTGLNHFRQTRWRKVFWTVTPEINIKHDTKYLIATKAIPNYDLSITISPTTLANLKNKFSGNVTEPMSNGLAVAYMPATGGRPDIGLLPGWAVSYLLSQDKDAKNATLGTADLAGSWSAHYRDKNTGKPIDLFDYPYMTILGHYGDTYNPTTKKYEAFPTCGGVCSNVNTVDGAHTPNFAYLPYIVTGDYYYLEELEFWAMYHAFATNPGYRQNIKGIVNSEQVRGQAWNLRTIGEAGYIVPDNDPLKSHFNTIIDNNMDWYNTNYTNNPLPQNNFGALLHGYGLVYNDSTGLAPWQDDFFTQAIGHLVELGYSKAEPLLKWKAKFSVSRMTDPGYCWIAGANYTLSLKATKTSAFYTNWSDVYKATINPQVASTACASSDMTKALRATGYTTIIDKEMTGYSSSTEGYPSNLQPALAYSATTGIPNATRAWSTFMSRSIKPNYGYSAQFAIVPRQ